MEKNTSRTEPEFLRIQYELVKCQISMNNLWEELQCKYPAPVHNTWRLNCLGKLFLVLDNYDTY